MSQKINVTAEIHVPRVPSFLRFADDSGMTIDIADVTDDALRGLGQEWTDALVAHAQLRRREAVPNRGQQ